ncbi:hypothetical protein M231_03380 [Tremella mesenterica]|uniref:Abscisic acid G-protein coupled receptor-like domain-containing protein n=1 Tax=Tremella mesenterica TaxID=5217 RepID=A0A4Q1BN71_TREME|nr:hypothetical protein M231_03380 [Tremella mesenterica]
MESESSSIASLPRPSKSSAILLDTLFLIALRLLYFFLSRRFLLATLNPTLRDISKADTAAAILPTEAPRTPTRHNSNLAASDFELDTVSDDDPFTATPNSSYPPSPAGGIVRDPFSRDRADERFLGHGLPSSPSGESLELQSFGQKLQNADRPSNGGAGRVQVLQLTHARSSSAHGVKKATRGLHRASRLLFGLCFAEGCNLITLVIFHSLGILHARSRHVNFSISLHVVLAMVLLFVPLVQCLLLTYRSRDPSNSSISRQSSLPLSSRLLIALIPFTLYIFLFTRIPPYVTAVAPMVAPSAEPENSVDVDLTDGVAPSGIDEVIVNWSTSGPEGWEGGGWLAPSLGRLIVLGVVVLGGLSGFGAVRTAWGFFEHASGARSRPVTDSDLLQAERSLYRVRHELIAKREELNRLAVPSTPGGSSWMGRVFGSREDQESASVRAELSGLQAMERQVSRSATAMKLRKRTQEFGHTLRGRIYHVLGYIFAVYCAARLLMCLPSLFLSPLSTSQLPNEPETQSREKGNTNGDWISFLLALGLSHLPTGSTEIDVAMWSRSISLLLTGLLILSSLAQVLRSLMRVLKLTSKTVGAGFLLLSLGQLFATYVISLLVQLRTTLPPSPEVDTDPFSPFYSNTTSIEITPASGTTDSLLSSLPDFRVFGRLFDVMFLLAALGTVAYRYIERKVNAADELGEVYR